MNLILTPVYMAFSVVKEMCAAIDKFSTMPYLHVLIDDNSPEFPPIKTTDNRKWILLRDDPNKSKNNMGRALQAGWDFAHHKCSAYGVLPEITNFFIIESDVIVQEDWDKLQIEASVGLTNWASLDVVSIYEGVPTYPTSLNKPIIKAGEDIDEIPFPEFQCTLFSKEFIKVMPKFTDYPSHFDMLFGRFIEKKKMKCYRHREIQAIHKAHASRKELHPNLF